MVRGEENDIEKYGFVIILIKIVGYNDPEVLGTLNEARKTDLCLTVCEGLPLAVEISPAAWQGLWLPLQAAILILSSNMCRKFTASFHLVTKEHSAPGFPLSSLFRRVLQLISCVEWDTGSYRACHWPRGSRSQRYGKWKHEKCGFTSAYGKKNPDRRRQKVVPPTTGGNKRINPVALLPSQCLPSPL